MTWSDVHAMRVLVQNAFEWPSPEKTMQVLDDLEKQVPADPTPESVINLMVAQFSSDGFYDGAEVIGRIRGIQLILDGVEVDDTDDPAGSRR